MTGATWFTSDLHFGHPFVASLRGFGTSREDADTDSHDAAIIAKWIARVQPEDKVWVLGDLVGRHKDLEYALAIIRKLPGTKHLIAGNHDAVSSIHREGWKFQKQFLESFESVQQFGRVRVQGQNILMSHFPYLGSGSDHTDDVRYTQYRLPDEGDILLHGHTHSSQKFHISDNDSLQIHVGVDAWDLAPVHLGTIDKMVVTWLDPESVILEEKV